MTRRTKRTFFLTLTVFFLITSFSAISYSLGWRFDWNTKKITQPGLFYFKVLPKSAQIYLNDKLKKKTDFFFGSALIDNLLPKKYRVEIKKEGFYSWEKTLEIKERQATEAKNIVLIPKNPKFTVVSGNIEDVFFSPDNKKIILKEKSVSGGESQIPSDSWELKLFDMDKNLKSQLIKEKDISPAHNTMHSVAGEEKKVRLVNLEFSPNSKRVLLKVELSVPFSKQEKGDSSVKNEEDIVYYLLEISKIPPFLTPLDFLDTVGDSEDNNGAKKENISNRIKQDIEEIYFNPQDPQKLFILVSETSETNETEKELKEIDLIKKKVSSTPLKNIIACKIINNNIYYIDDSGFLNRTDFSFKNQEKLNLIPLEISPVRDSEDKKQNQEQDMSNLAEREKEYKIAVSGSNLILKKGSDLYSFLENKFLQKISDSIENFKLAPDSKKLAYFNDREIWILFLEKKYDRPQKENGEKLFLTRFSEKIDNLFWYTNAYLIFNVGNKLKIAEIDERDKINIIELADFENPQIFWNQRNNKLYILSKGNLYYSEKLLP